MWEALLQVEFSVGFAVGALVSIVFTSFLAVRSYQRALHSEAQLRREMAMLHMELMRLSPEQSAQVEVKITRDFARQLDEIDRKSSVLNKVLLVIVGIGGSIGLFVTLSKLLELLRGHGLSFFLISPTYAATNVRAELAPYLPLVFFIIIGILGLAFIASLIMLLSLKETTENKVRIQAADTIVKTFGGFFTGLATTLLT